MTPDGRYVLFNSLADNLVPGDDNGLKDVFLRDLQTKTTRLVSADADGSVPEDFSFACNASADFQKILFRSRSSNIVSPPDPNGRRDVFLQTCPPVPTSYCQAEPNSLGCVPAIGASGTPSASSPSGFQVTCDNVLSQRAGLFFYSLTGPRLTPFQGGLRCVESPTRRTPLVASGGSASLDCSGQLALDFNAWIASGADPALVAGQEVWGQWWSRDAGSSFSTNLSDAIYFALEP